MQTIADADQPKTGTMIVDIQGSIPELGKIKIGRKKDKEKGRSWRLPEKLGYFLVTTLQRDSREDFEIDELLTARLADLQAEATGREVKLDERKVPKITEIPVMLLSDEILDSVKAVYSAYSGRKRLAECDGRWCTYYYNGDKKLDPPQVHRCTGEHATQLDNKKNRLFKPHTTLSVVIRGGADGMSLGGVHRFRTTSIISLEQIIGSLKMIQGLTRGFLANIPLVLVVRPMQVAPNGIASTVYVVHFEIRTADMHGLQREVIALAEAEKTNVRALLQARNDIRAATTRPEDELEQAEIADEFHPGQDDPTVIEVPATVVTTPAAEKVVKVPAAKDPPAAPAKPAAKPKPDPKPKGGLALAPEPAAEPAADPTPAAPAAEPAAGAASAGAICSECKTEPAQADSELCGDCDLPF